MSLVRWFRKNNSKLMAVVVIVLLIGFIGGSSLSTLLSSRGGQNEVVAYIGDREKVTNYDLSIAARELELLQSLGSDNILKMLQYPLLQVPDLHAVVLSELLFSDRQPSPEIIGFISQQVGNNLYRISEKQISDIYERSQYNAVYWYCLCKETESAGIRISNEGAGELLGQAIPQMYNGLSYSQVINSIMNSQGLAEDEILAIFAKLLSVLQYSHLVSAEQNMTSFEIGHIMASNRNTIDIEYVEFNSNVFAKVQPEPDEAAILEQFNKYKGFFPGQVSEDNPYGFGYKQPERLKLEYIALKLDDVATIVDAPSQDEMEDYYNRNKSTLYTEQVQSDPNDPNSAMVTQLKPYSRVSSAIAKQLRQERITSKARVILQEAKNLAETNFSDYNDIQLQNLSSAQLAQSAADYKTIAEQLSNKYKIKIYVGSTGMLSAEDILRDEYLSALYIENQTSSYSLPVEDYVFAVDELASSDLGIYNLRAPRLYQDIGPFSDVNGQVTDSSKQITSIFRVVETRKAAEPESLDATYSTVSIVFDSESPEAQVYSVRKIVTEDLKRLSAMESTKTSAGAFLELAADQGWDEAVEQFNDLYGDKSQDANDVSAMETDESEPFTLQEQAGLQLASNAVLDVFTVQSAASPMSRQYDYERQKSQMLVQQLYSLLPADSNSLEVNEPQLVEFKPQMCYYCVKNVTFNPLWKEDFEKAKAMQLYREELNRIQSLSVVQLNPENILKRMQFRLIMENQESASAADKEQNS